MSDKRPLMSATTGAVVTPTKKEVHDLTEGDDTVLPAIPSTSSTIGSAKKPPLSASSTRNPSEFKPRAPIPRRKVSVTPTAQNATPLRSVVTQQLQPAPQPPQPRPTSSEVDDDVWRHPEAYAYSQNERESISAYLPLPLVSPDPHEVKEPPRPIASVVETTTINAPLPTPPPALPHPKFGAPATAGYSLGPLEETLQPAISRATSDALASTASASHGTSATPMEIDSSAEPVNVKPANKRIKLVRPSLTPSVDSLPPRPPSPVKSSDQPASTSSTPAPTSKRADEQPATASTSEHGASLSKPSKMKRASEGDDQPAGVVLDTTATNDNNNSTNDAPQPPPQKKQKRGRKSAAASANANDLTLTSAASSTTVNQPTPPVPAAESAPAPPTTTSSNPEERLADVYAKQLVSQRKSAAKVKLDILAGEISTVHHDPHRKHYLTGTKFHDDNLEIGDSSTVFSWTEYVQHLVSRLIQTNLQQQQESLITHRASIGPHQRMNLRKLDDALTKERVERYEREQAADQEDEPIAVDGTTDGRRGRKRRARSTSKSAKGTKTKSAAAASTSPVKKKRRGRQPKGTSTKKE